MYENAKQSMGTYKCISIHADCEIHAYEHTQMYNGTDTMYILPYTFTHKIA